MVSQDSHPSHCTERRKIGNKSRRKIVQEHVAPNKKNGVHLERSLQKSPCNEKDAPRKARTWRQIFTCSRVRTKLRFTVLLKPAERRRPLQNLQRIENSWLIHGTSMHMLSKKDLSSEEMEILRRFRTPFVVVDGKWRSENKQGSSSARSRSWPLRHCAITRRNACISNAW